MKQIGSVTTTSPGEQPSRIGTPRGERGLATSESSRLVAWLVKSTPVEVDAAAVLRASQLGVGLRVALDHRFPKDDRGNPLPAYSVVRGCSVTGDREKFGEVAEAIQRLETPAPSGDIEGWLAELSVITAKRHDDEFAETLRIEAYASRLRRYPADVARQAVVGCSWRFWPTWAELETICERLVAPRRAMVANLLAKRVDEQAEPRQRVTEEKAASIVREIYGEGQ